MNSKRKRKENLENFCFTIPAVILVCMMMYIPFVMSGFYSLTEWNGISKAPAFVGLKNFKDIFSGSSDYVSSLLFTIRYTFVFVILSNVVDWKLETDIRKKRLLNYSIDFGICIFCGNCVEYCPTNCLSMTEEYELSTYDRHELNYNQIALGRLPMSVIDDYTIRTILNSPQIKNG